jgi:hypothetical protein
MLKFNEATYQIIKQKAEANAGGQIHQVGGVLGRILNGSQNYIYWINHDDVIEAARILTKLEDDLEILGELDQRDFLFKDDK